LEANVAISSVILIKDFIWSPELFALALGPSGLVPLSLEMMYFRCLLFYHFRSIMRSPFIPSFLSAEASSSAAGALDSHHVSAIAHLPFDRTDDA
jgi:hypothetical protein